MTDINVAFNKTPIPAHIIVELTVMAMHRHPGEDVHVIGIQRQIMKGEWKWALWYNDESKSSRMVTVKA